MNGLIALGSASGLHIAWLVHGFNSKSCFVNEVINWCWKFWTCCLAFYVCLFLLSLSSRFGSFYNNNKNFPFFKTDDVRIENILAQECIKGHNPLSFSHAFGKSFFFCSFQMHAKTLFVHNLKFSIFLSSILQHFFILTHKPQLYLEELSWERDVCVAFCWLSWERDENFSYSIFIDNSP